MKIIKANTIIRMTIVVFFIAILAMIALPDILNGTHKAMSCITNLEQIERAKMHWAIDHNKTVNEAPTQAELVPIYIAKWPTCPKNGRYLIGSISQEPTCSFGGRHKIGYDFN